MYGSLITGPGAFSFRERPAHPKKGEPKVDEIRCEIRLAEVEGSPPRLVGTLLALNVRAKDRAEMFLPGSVSWPEGGLVLNRQHQRGAPIMRITPTSSTTGLTVDQELPNTVAGRDAAEEIRGGLLTGLSVEFRAIQESIVGGCRQIASAALSAAALVDSPSYPAPVEVREHELRDREWERWQREQVL